MNKTEMKEKVLQAIRNMNSNELYSLCLEFSDVNGGCDPVYSMDEVDDIFCDVPPSKIRLSSAHTMNISTKIHADNS